jgi:transposase
VLDGANRHDVKLVESTLASLPPAVEAARQAHQAQDASQGQGLCLDAGYDSKQVRETLAALGYTAHIRPRSEEVPARKAGQKARRWGRPGRVVERTHSWLNRFRHLLIRCAKKPENYLAMLHFACVRITWYNCLFGLTLSLGGWLNSRRCAASRIGSVRAISRAG